MWVVLGPTATGKTELAIHLAKKYQGEVISADSRQVYKGMDLGTGKDLMEYGGVPYHLIDIVPAGSHYDVYQFKRDALLVHQAITTRENQSILCGGSGMFIDAIVRDYDLRKVVVNNNLRDKFSSADTSAIVEELSKYTILHNTTDSNDRERALRALEIAIFKKQNPYKPEVLFETNIIGVFFPKEQLKNRIKIRLEKRFDEGMVQEVKGLLKNGLAYDTLMYYGLEYKYIGMYVVGEISFNDCFQKLNAAIVQFSKRQMTWFRKMEKKGVMINWIDGSLPLDEKLELAEGFLL